MKKNKERTNINDSEKINEDGKQKWYYTEQGKLFRGFLCMVSFAVFMAGVVFVVAGVSDFGVDVLKMSNVGYDATYHYSNSLAQTYADVVRNASIIEDAKKRTKFRIYNFATDEIEGYDIPAPFDTGHVENSGESPEVFTYKYDSSRITEAVDETSTKMSEKLENYWVSVTSFTNNLSNYSAALAILEQEASKGSYLYFDKDSFKDLFKNCGSRNTAFRYNTDFSEDAYFVFAGGEKSIDESWGYAVYDEERDLYYSEWDDFFEPYDEYIYDCQEVLNTLDERTGSSRQELDSIILPLLWSSNMSKDDILRRHRDLALSSAEEAIHNLEKLENDAFVYYVGNTGFTYSNVENLNEITELADSYCVRRGVQSGATVQGDINALAGDYGGSDGFFENLLSTCFEDRAVVVYFGLDYTKPEKQKTTDTSVWYQSRERYEAVTKDAVFVLAGIIVLFILLIIQAVSLIRTTGRAGKVDKERGINVEVKLYSYDRLATEIWFLITGIVLTVTGGFGMWVLLTQAFHKFRSQPLVQSMQAAAAGALPFAFCFMILTLSFARRIKAKNLKDCMCAGRIYRQCRQGFSVCGKKGAAVYKKWLDFYYRKSGADRLWFLFIGYLVILLACAYLVMLGIDAGAREIVMFAGGILFVVNICTIIVMYCLRRDMKRITECVEQITKGELDSKCSLNVEKSFLKELADGVNHIGDGLKTAVETSLKDERMKTELITNVSHDLKTPLTSIINYVDLLKKEDMPSGDAKHYLEVLDAKSQRLKQLTEDLVEAAKANSGNIELECMPLAFDELMRQAIGEFEDKFAGKDLTVIATYPEEPAVIMADGRRLFRVIENLLQNAYKYALEGTRIYADLSANMGQIIFTLKNVSKAQLNIGPEELMERFTRGDASRTTEGSGLGLSIAKDLTRLMKGSFDIQLDGDLFKVIVSFPEYKK